MYWGWIDVGLLDKIFGRDKDETEGQPFGLKIVLEKGGKKIEIEVYPWETTSILHVDPPIHDIEYQYIDKLEEMAELISQALQKIGFRVKYKGPIRYEYP